MRFASRFPSWMCSVCLSSLALTACKKEEQQPQIGNIPAVSSTVAPAASAAGAGPSAVAPAAEAPCVVEKEKVWGKWVNERAGITVTELPNSKAALGVAFGNRPTVLTVNPDGDAVLTRIDQADGSKVGRKLETKVGRRDLQRVTPMVRDGKTHAFADYRDRLTDGTRRVACGPAENDQALLVFDGVHVLDKLEKEQKAAGAAEPDKPGKPTPETVTSAAPAEPAAPGNSAAPAPAASAAPGSPMLKLGRLGGALKRLPGLAQPEKLTEVRDCRTFVDQRRGEVWGVGSELVGEPKDGEYTWEMRFFVRTPGGAQNRIHTAKLGTKPKVLHTLEAPVAARLGDDYALVARYQGGTLAWHLDSGFRLKGNMKRYGGGYPSLVRFVPDGNDLRLWTSQKIDKENWRVSSMRLAGGFGSSLTKLELGAGSQAEPGFARAGDQRWLSYQAGPRRKATLQLQAVDGDLNPQGTPHPLTPEGDEIYESVLLPLSGGKIYLTMIRRPSGEQAPELVSQVLSCKGG